MWGDRPLEERASGGLQHSTNRVQLTWGKAACFSQACWDKALATAAHSSLIFPRCVLHADRFQCPLPQHSMMKDYNQDEAGLLYVIPAAALGLSVWPSGGLGFCREPGPMLWAVVSRWLPGG